MNGERANGLQPQRTVKIFEAPAEHIVGDPLEVTLRVQLNGNDNRRMNDCDWVGIYPRAVPTLPGLSHGRWRYISRDAVAVETAARAASGGNWSLRKVRFDAAQLPNHRGWFDVRVHLSNGYGVPHDEARVYFSEGNLPRWKLWALLFFIIGIVGSYQGHLNSKGVCRVGQGLTPGPYFDDVFDDFLTRSTAPLNWWMIQHPTVAEACQALSSFSLDCTIMFLLYVSTTQRSSVRPFFSVFLFQTFRFLAQILATIPCAPGYFFPPGKLLGYQIPSLFVDYHPANDYFFSGHVGTTLVLGIELFALDYTRLGLFQILATLPVMCAWVVVGRVHRGIDVLAGLLAAVASSAISKEMSFSVDQFLRERKRIPKHHFKTPQTQGEDHHVSETKQPVEVFKIKAL